MNKQKDYANYQTEDFLNDSYFLLWMQNKDPKINAFWEGWKREHTDKIPQLLEAERQYYLLTSFDRLTPKTQDKKEVWDKIELGIRACKKKSFRRRAIRWASAAAIILLLVTGWLLQKQRSEKVEFVTVQSGNTQKEFRLPDGSDIVMNKYTTLKYHPGDLRTFWLTGQAYFSVKHSKNMENAAVPFIVHSGIEKITVLGTSFTVKSLNNTAHVILVSGKIKASVGNKSIMMKPGEKAIWKKDAFHSEKVNPQLYLAWKTGEFHFDHTSLKELSGLIKDYYGYDLVIKNKAELQSTTISGTITAKDEKILWKTLAVMFHVRVKKQGSKIILTAY